MSNGGIISTELYSGDTAHAHLERYLAAMADDDATGQTIAMARNGEMLDQNTLELSGLPMADVLRILKQSQCELLILDGGNKHGDSWKVLYHPLTTLLVVVPETQP